MTFGNDLKIRCGKSLKFVLGFKQITDPIDQCLNDSSPQFLSLFPTDADKICQPKKGFVSITAGTPTKYFEKVGWKMD